jgi:hypothetical protein
MLKEQKRNFTINRSINKRQDNHLPQDNTAPIASDGNLAR